MAADGNSDASVENKMNEEQNSQPYFCSRAHILMDFDLCMNGIQFCGKEASTMHGTIVFGKLQVLAMESQLTLMNTLKCFNPCNYLRKEYRAQDYRKASGFFDEVEYCLNLCLCDMKLV